MNLPVYSNQEVFGGNALILDYVALGEFTPGHTQRFKNLDVRFFVSPQPDTARALSG